MFLAARPGPAVRLAVGHVAGGLLDGWSESNRTSLDPDVGALNPPDPAHPVRAFRFRKARPGSSVRLPLYAAGGELRLRLEAMARVRTAVSFHADGRTLGEVVIPRGPWRPHELVLAVPPGVEPGRVALALEALPLVRVPDGYVARPEVPVAAITVASPDLRLGRAARLLLAAVPVAVFAFALVIGAGPPLAAAGAVTAAAAALALARADAIAVLVGVRLLLPVALAAGLATWLVLRRRPAFPGRVVAGLAALVAAGVLAHGALPFVPGHDPHDVEVHVRRTRDLGTVPLEYEALLRYGSHLPTATQTFGTATAALGERTLVPYPPLSYVAFYALHRLGIDLLWGMTALDAVLAMGVVPLLWLVGARAWSAGAGWLAAILYTLDLPVWHHLARAHTPATFGGALGTALLLALALLAARLSGRRAVAGTAAAVAVVLLGYSSLIVLFALFGVALLLVLVLDARGLDRAAKTGLVAALVAGGLLSGVLFYFHYLPGLIGGLQGIQAEPDLFRPRTYLVFHNESRQAMRVWQAGFVVPLAAGLLAAPAALRAAAPAVRPVLAAWLFTWPLVMLAKEPFLFPRPLRWAKEDQFLSPLLALLVGGAVARLPAAWMRWAAAGLAVAVAAWLQWGDFRVHASGILQ